ncbi:MAG: GNAT family N-acetyltransferase [Pseudomonadota bacterium]|nr:GNAT family N-acetyltransferase [Pseudomonadota bacterium]
MTAHQQGSETVFTIRPMVSDEADYLLALSDAYLAGLYPAESCHLVSPVQLRKSALVFLGAFCDEDCVGCAALMDGHRTGYAEVKRLFVAEAFRGRGCASQLMQGLEDAARRMNLSYLQLETGIYQPASHALYLSLGYRRIPPFGSYSDDPFSLFYEKQLF